MATIKLNPIITDIRKRMGSNVFSKWKGINYVRGYVVPTNRNTEEQASVRSTFLNLVNVWKNLGTTVQNTWNAFATGKNLTGYNAFIAENFRNMKSDLAMIIAKPMDEEPLAGFSAQPGTSTGEIRCSFTSTRSGRCRVSEPFGIGNTDNYRSKPLLPQFQTITIRKSVL